MTGPGSTPLDHPLELGTPIATHVFGGRAIAERLGRSDLPGGRIAETWEVSDVEGMQASVATGPLAGTSLRALALSRPDELVGRGWRGEAFPLLTKYIDASGMLPVHLHPDDVLARERHGMPNGKTEAWHVLDAAPGATALCGVREGVGRDELRRALLAGEFDAVLRRLPVRAGETLYVPGGTVHSFGPDTLVYEIEQTSDLQQHAMPWRMEDGSALTEQQWHAGVDALVEEWRPAPRPDFTPGLSVRVTDDVERVVLTAGPYFALERWRVAGSTTWRLGFDGARVLSNAGAPVTLRGGAWRGRLERGRTLLLPAALGEVEMDGPADVLVGYLPDLPRDVREPLLAGGHGAAAVAALGEGLGGPGAAVGDHPAATDPGARVG